MIDLIVDAFGAPPGEKNLLEGLAKTLLMGQRARLRRMARAPLCAAELRAETTHLIEEAGRQRRSRAAKYRPNAYQPPMATRTELDGTVNIAGTKKRPSREGYLLKKDLVNILKLSQKQRHFAAELIGRPLGAITVWPPGAASPRVLDLAEMWRKVAARSQAVTRHMAKASSLMVAFETKSKECARLLAEAHVAKQAGALAKSRDISKKAIEAANAADKLRREAKDSGDDAYALVRNAFWNEAHKQPDLIAHLKENLGLKFLSDGPNATRGAPYYELPGGKEGLTLEHLTRRNDDPRLTVEPGNLIVSPTTENVLLNEAIRNGSPLPWR